MARIPNQVVTPEMAQFLRLWQTGISIRLIAKRLHWHKDRVHEYANWLRSEGIRLWEPFDVDYRLDMFPDFNPDE